MDKHLLERVKIIINYKKINKWILAILIYSKMGSYLVIPNPYNKLYFHQMEVHYQWI
jgi:hypothetical protein